MASKKPSRAMHTVTDKELAGALKKSRNVKTLKAVTKELITRRNTGSRQSGSVMGPFGGVSELTAAPVTLGNTIHSVRQNVIPTRDGVRVVGRDFVQAIGGTTAAFSGWCLQGGMALSPMSLNASGLRGFFQSYEYYQWLRVDAHYITSSPTSLAGDILLMYHANHGGPKVDHSSANFLSYALSTDAALIGPQWTNHSVRIISRPGAKLMTDVLNAEDVQHQADGELLVYTRNTTNGTSPDNPGYLLIDYDVHFSKRMLNPRVQTLPSGIFKWSPLGVEFSGTVTAGDSVAVDTATTNTYAGVTAAAPAGTVAGDLFQVVVDLANATFGGTLSAGSQATMWNVVLTSTGVGAGQVLRTMAYPITTGTTIYAVYRGNTVFDLFPNYDAALAGQSLRWAANSVGLGLSFVVIMCAVGSVNAIFQQANIG